MIRPGTASGGEEPLSRLSGALALADRGRAPVDEVVLVVGGQEGEARPMVGHEPKCVVARLVLAGIATRLELPVDMIERLQRALDELLRAHERDASATVEFTRSEDELTFYVGPLLLRLPDRRRLERVVDAAVDDVVWGDDRRGTWVLARMSRRSDGQTTR